MPILKSKRWKRCRWASQAGVGKKLWLRLPQRQTKSQYCEPARTGRRAWIEARTTPRLSFTSFSREIPETSRETTAQAFWGIL